MKIFVNSEVQEAIEWAILEAHNRNPELEPHKLLQKAFYVLSTDVMFIKNVEPFTVVVQKEETKTESVTNEDGSITTTTKHIPEKKEVRDYVKVSLEYVLGHNPWATFERTADLSVIPQKPNLVHNKDAYRYIKACKKLFPNIDAYNYGTAVTTFARVIENFWANVGLEGAKNRQVCFYQYSALGGTGKSRFHEILHKFCDKYKVNSKEAQISGRWINNDFTNNLIATVGEYFPPRSGYEKDETIINTNNIIDNTFYKIELKASQPVLAKSISTVFINSNKLPFDTNTRRYGIVKYNELPYSKISEEDRKEYLGYTEDELIEAFKDAFESAPFGFEVADILPEQGNQNFAELVYMADAVVEAYQTGHVSIDIRNATPRSFAKAFTIATTGSESPEVMKKNLFIIRENIREAVVNGLIAPSKKIRGNLDYSQYDIQELADCKTIEDDVDTSNDALATQIANENNPLKATAIYADALIEALKPTDPTEPTDPTTPTTPTDDTPTEPSSDNTFTADDLKAMGTPVCKDKYSSPTFTPSEDTQFIVTARYTPDFIRSGEPIDRKGEHMIPTHFVYESDELSLEEQAAIADKLLSSDKKKYVQSVTYSGSKSWHILVKVANGEALKEDFKYWWNKCAIDLFGVEVANKMDEACASVARLSRFPNGKRDNGTIQECVYMNKDCDSYVFSKADIEAYNHKKDLEVLAKQNAISKARTFEPKSEIETLKNFYKANPQKWQLAYDVLVDGKVPPSGSDMIGTIGALRTSQLNECTTAFTTICNKYHPSNIGYVQMRKIS